MVLSAVWHFSCLVGLLQYDANYVGTVLPKEVTFCNLNNNINDMFLREMCKSYGVIDDVTIYYHPKTRRHLGIGTVMDIPHPLYSPPGSPHPAHITSSLSVFALTVYHSLSLSLQPLKPICSTHLLLHSLLALSGLPLTELDTGCSF